MRQLRNMQPPSIHSSFFSSLKQVEKRLKLENPSQPPTPSPPPPPSQETYSTPIESQSSPIYLKFNQPNTSSNVNNVLSLQSSEPPREFLSGSLDFQQTHENSPPTDTVQDPETINRAESIAVDEIQSLIQLLGFSDREGEGEGEGEGKSLAFGLKNGGRIRGNCGHECGFYSKIIGVKGPKCGKEVERLEGWIKHFRNDGGEGSREPLRLAHLLLAKAAYLSEGSDDFGKFEFPSTVEEFLHNDPTKY